MRENLDDELTEVKSENAIDRITSQANPRTLERVPAGARFQVRFVIDILCQEDRVLPGLLVEGLRLLEDDTLGGGGSRGSGRVGFATCDWLGAAAASMPRALPKCNWPRAPICPRCNPWSAMRNSRPGSLNSHADRLCRSLLADRALADRTRFRRARPRGDRSAQRRGLFGGDCFHGPNWGSSKTGSGRPLRIRKDLRCGSVPATLPG